jgi:putative transposase
VDGPTAPTGSLLQQAEAGTSVEETAAEWGISQATFFRWKWKNVYGGLMPSEVRTLKPRHEENRRLRKLVADLTLDKEMPTLPDGLLELDTSLICGAPWKILSRLRSRVPMYAKPLSGACVDKADTSFL